MSCLQEGTLLGNHLQHPAAPPYLHVTFHIVEPSGLEYPISLDRNSSGHHPLVQLIQGSGLDHRPHRLQPMQQCRPLLRTENRQDALHHL